MSSSASMELTFLENFLLGGTAAAVSKTVAAPLERVKLLIQNQGEMLKRGTLDKPYSGFVDCVLCTYRTEGILPFWRGNMANVIRYFPTQALNFSFLNKIKALWISRPDDTYARKLYVNMSSGGCAGSTSLVFVYSLDYARTRLANDILLSTKGSHRKFSGLVDVYVKTFRNDGLRGLYRGFVISCCGIFVYRGIYFGVYDTVKPLLLRERANFLLSFLLAYLVTVIGETVTYPLDTVRRRMMMSSMEALPYRNSFNCAQEILRHEGLYSFMKGAGANVLRGFAGAVLLSGFDKFKEWYIQLSKTRPTT